jgi:3-oxoacyl-[acyl-carrier protein] reductase
MKFSDKVIIVTGSGRGLGKCIAKMFLENGAKVVINDRVQSRLDMAKKELVNYNDRLLPIFADIGIEKNVKYLIDETIKKYGKIDVLINNAGMVYDRPFNEQKVEEWDDTYSSNLKGTFLCSKYASQFLKQTKGNIINISSTNGINTIYPWSMDYDATKAGIINLTKNLAIELSPDVRVNSIAPGWINTDMNKELPEEIIEEENKKILLRRFCEPEEIANVILFLASDEARYINQEIIRVDGGMQ